jgi:hypothetical protein
MGVDSITARTARGLNVTDLGPHWLPEAVHQQIPVAGVRVPNADAVLRDLRPLWFKKRSSYRASGSGRSWKCRTLLVVPLPPSMWNGARVLTVAHSPFPFHPALGSSIRPSIHFV